MTTSPMPEYRYDHVHLRSPEGVMVELVQR